jgi:hypothetical protein
MKARDINRCKNVKTKSVSGLTVSTSDSHLWFFLHICTFEKFRYKENLGKIQHFFCLLPLPKGNCHHSDSVCACVRAIAFNY